MGRAGVLSGDLTDDEYVSIVRWLRRKGIPFTPYSGCIVANGKAISHPRDAIAMGWKP